MTDGAFPLRVLLVDDEALARARLRDLLAETADPPTRVVGEAADAGAAIAWLRTGVCDLVLLDIAMPGKDGLALAAELARLPVPPSIVFVTAHAEHALSAFELAAVDYLTKPVRRERLRAALQRVAARRPAAPETPPIDVAGAMAPAAPSVVVVHDRGGLVRVPIGEVLYFKAELKYVTLRTAARSYLLDDALADLETRFGDRFLRIHRNALVARQAMRSLERRPAAARERDDEGGEGWAVQVAAVAEWLAVSRRQVAAVREALTTRAG